MIGTLIISVHGLVAKPQSSLKDAGSMVYLVGAFGTGYIHEANYGWA
jgi:hypothetical protein